MKDYGELALGRSIQKILSVKCKKPNKSKINVVKNGITDIYELCISIYFNNSDLELTYTLASHILENDKYKTSYDWMFNLILHKEINKEEYNLIKKHGLEVHKYLQKNNIIPTDFYVDTTNTNINFDKERLTRSRMLKYFVPFINKLKKK